MIESDVGPIYIYILYNVSPGWQERARSISNQLVNSEPARLCFGLTRELPIYVSARAIYGKQLMNSCSPPLEGAVEVPRDQAHFVFAEPNSPTFIRILSSNAFSLRLGYLLWSSRRDVNHGSF